MLPEFHPFTSDVEVCATVSEFIQVTVVPGEMVTSSGVKALFPNTSAPRTIVTDADGRSSGVSE
jgi:hypothetical protein